MRLGVSVSVSAIIFFTSFALCLSMVFSATQVYYEGIKEAEDQNALRTQNSLHASFEIRSAGYNATQKVLSLNLTNTGSSTLATRHLDVLTDGVLVTGNITSIKSGASAAGQWYPATTITITLKQAQKPERVKVCSEYGVSAYTSTIQRI